MMMGVPSCEEGEKERREREEEREKKKISNDKSRRLSSH
jgi:hypothetical protein